MRADLDELISETQQQLQISAYAIEKDFYITQALFALSSIEDEKLKLVFKGGTCLAKAHKIINRMSEDCDFRITCLPGIKFTSKQSLRNHVRNFRRDIQAALETNGFSLTPEQISVGNEGQFMQIYLYYDTKQNQHPVLRPHILLEFFQADLKMDTLQLPITSLIKETLGDAVPHATQFITCIGIEETFAEKWVALLRRGSLSQHNQKENTLLIRHLYDIYKLSNQIKVESNDNIIALIKTITEEDRFRYRNQDQVYFQNPIETFSKTLNAINTDMAWKNDWETFMNSMVFHYDRVLFITATEKFMEISNFILSVIKR